MELSTIKNLVLEECAREKRIVLRNLAIVILLLCICAGLIFAYALPQLTKYLHDAANSVNTSSNFSKYYKFVIPIAILLTLFYPLMALIQVLKRAKKVEDAFDKISQNASINILTEKEEYLTVLPLGKIKINLNPITYLLVVIDNKSFELPVDPSHLSDLKIGLSGANTQKVYSILDAIYSDEKLETEMDKPYPIQPLSAFESFADRELKEDIEAMEGGRSKMTGMFYIQFLIAVLFVGSIVYFVATHKLTAQNIPMLVGGFIGFVLLFSGGMYMYNRMALKNKNFPDYLSFKKHVFNKIVNFVNPNFEYIDKGQITVPEFLHSGMFKAKDYKISGADQILGVHDGVPFQSSNLTVRYRPSFSNEKDPDKIVFYGNYFVARFNKTFQSPIFIYPKNSFWTELKDNDINEFLEVSLPKVKLEDPEFDKQFEVYCEDQIMARYVLTPTMMERLKTINARSKGNFHIAINKQNIVLANNISSKAHDLSSIQSTMFTSLDLKLVNSLYEEFTENLAMIDVLKLNINIWK